MADLRQRIKVEATLKDGVSRGLEGIRKSSDKSLGDKTGIAAHAGKAKLAMAGLATGVVAVGGAILKVTRDVARHNDEIAKMSSRIGASTEALSQYEFVAKRSGIEFRTLTMGWQRMTRRISEAAKGTGEARGALKELNLSAAALNSLAPEDQFEAIAEAMQGVNGQADKVRLSMKLFDSEGVALVQTMADGAAGIRALREEADELGLTLTGEAAAAAEAFEDQITNLTARTDALKKAFAEGLIVELGNFEDAISGPSMKESFGQFGGWVGAAIVKTAALASLLAKIHALGTQKTPQQIVAEMADENEAEAGPTVVTNLSRHAGSAQFGSRALPGGTMLGMRDRPGPIADLSPRSPRYQPSVPSLSNLGVNDIPTVGNSIPIMGGAVRAGEVAGSGYGLGFSRGLEGTTGERAGAQGGTILNLLARGRATDSQAVIDRLADKTGDQAGKQVLQGWRTRIAKDGDQDIVTPFGDVATTAGESFTENLEISLTLGLAEFILEGDLKGATKTFGATLAAGMVVDAAAELSGGITEKLGDAFKEGGFAREHLISSGQDIGKGLKTGANFALETLQVPDSFAAKFGAEGSVGKDVATRFGDALAGGVMGAAIGTMLGDEITAQASTIGGALGGALAGPVGSIIGSIAAAAASKIPVVGGVIADIFGITDSKTQAGIRELGTDIQAFGGVSGFFNRIGGLEGIRGERLKTIETDEGGAALAKAIRMSVGATGDQATDVIEVLRSVGRSRRAGGERGARVGFATQDIKSSQSEITNVLRDLGLDPDLIRFYERQTFIEDEGGERRGGMGSVMGPGGSGKRISGDADDDVEGNKPRLSVGEGMRAFQAGNFSARGEAFTHFLTGFNSPLGTQKGNNIIDLIASAGNNESARDYLSQFFDIVAARGYHGMVNRPTTILAGDRGPERVDITPGGAGFMGGASGSRGTVVHFNVNVQALDPRGVRELMEGEVGDMLIERIRASSERGETVIYSTGVTTPPSV